LSPLKGASLEKVIIMLIESRGQRPNQLLEEEEDDDDGKKSASRADAMKQTCKT
jgi:hypothetical protein